MCTKFFNNSSNDVAHKAYNLKAIKIEPADGRLEINSTSPLSDAGSTTSIANSPNGILSVSEGLTDGKSVTANNTIAALYSFVKRFDKDFSGFLKISNPATGRSTNAILKRSKPATGRSNKELWK